MVHQHSGLLTFALLLKNTLKITARLCVLVCVGVCWCGVLCVLVCVGVCVGVCWCGVLCVLVCCLVCVGVCWCGVLLVSCFVFTPVLSCHGEKRETSGQQGASVTAATMRLKIHRHWRFNHQFPDRLDEKQQEKKKTPLNERNASAVGIRFAHFSCTLQSPRHVCVK